MRLYLLLLTTGALVIRYAAAASPCCNYSQEVAAGQTLQVFSPNYPSNYSKGVDCRWETVAPSNSKININCNATLPQSNNCTDDRFSVSPSGDTSMSDAYVYCGTVNFTVESTNNRMVMTLTATNFSPRGTFMCSLTATVPTTPTPPTCDCGWKNETRMLNGHETGVTEYPMIAALIVIETTYMFCSATVIAPRYTVSLASCLFDMETNITGVLIKVHDTSTGHETNSTRLLRIEKFETHPDYNFSTGKNDIAVIRVTEDIVFTLQMGPACLPFRFPTTSVGTVVDVVGWSYSLYRGKFSKRLMGTQVDVVDIKSCLQATRIPVSTTNVLCTSKNGTDSCQRFLGGSMLWTGPGNRLYLVGVFGKNIECEPEVLTFSTPIYPYLNWILSVTPDAPYSVR